MSVGISRRASARASRAALLLAALVTGCGGGGGTPNPSPVTALRTIPLDQLYLLESSGAAPEDTTVTVPAGEERYLLVLYPPPDNTVFAELHFPAQTFAAPPGTPVTISVNPRPGLFALDFGSTVPLQPGATITFKYPVHFAAPLAAVRQYGDEDRYAAALGIGRLSGDDRVTFFPSDHPAPDDLRAALPGPGRYLVAAPR